MDIFYKMRGLTIRGITVTPSNVDSFGLHKRFESEICDIYSSSPKRKTGQFILHIKRPDLYAKDNDFLLETGYHKSNPEVDWSEDSLEDEIAYLKKDCNGR